MRGQGAPPSTNSHTSSPSEDCIRSDPAAFKWNQAERSDQVVSGNEDEEAELLGDDDAISRIGRKFSNVDGSFRREKPKISGTDPNLVGSEEVGYEESDSEECDLLCSVGITEEVLAFARNIAMHPETWLDFPIDEEEDTDGKSLFVALVLFIDVINVAGTMFSFLRKMLLSFKLFIFFIFPQWIIKSTRSHCCLWQFFLCIYLSF